MKISVIIPTLNEAQNLERLIPYLKQDCKTTALAEIIVVDGGSQDNTIEISKKLGVKVLKSPKKGRAAQMNYGANFAKGTVLYFIHADVIPPKDCFQNIITTLQNGYAAGCFTYQFDSKKWLLKINAFFTQFTPIWCRGGDQTLFVKKVIFEALGGYRNDFQIMEDYDLIKKLQENYSFKIIKNNVIVSARKYDTNSYLKVQWANFTVFRMYNQGASQDEMVATYKRLLDYR